LEVTCNNTLIYIPTSAIYIFTCTPTSILTGVENKEGTAVEELVIGEPTVVTPFHPLIHHPESLHSSLLPEVGFKRLGRKAPVPTMELYSLEIEWLKNFYHITLRNYSLQHSPEIEVGWSCSLHGRLWRRPSQ
jgi:hypothetical protein